MKSRGGGSGPPSGGGSGPPSGGGSGPPSRPDPGPRTPGYSWLPINYPAFFPAFFLVKNVFRLKLDAKSIPEALATTFRILEKFSIDLAHRYPGRGWAPQNRPRTPPTPPQSDPRLTV